MANSNLVPSPYSEENLIQLNQILGTCIAFDHLKIAITTRAAKNENPNVKVEDNQKLEFLGDSVLKLTVSESLMDKGKDVGELTRFRVKLEKNKALGEIALALGLKKYLFLGEAEKTFNGKAERKLLSDTFEALIGSLYLSCGLEESRSFVMKFVMPRLLSDLTPSKDSVTYFNEMYQAKYKISPEWDYTRIGGTDDMPRFKALMSIDDEILIGEGGSKKEARENAILHYFTRTRSDVHADN